MDYPPQWTPMQSVIRQLIEVTDDELLGFLMRTTIRQCSRNEILFTPGPIPEEVFFINQGLIRVFITGHEGTEYTIHFAMENQFIADYANFILRTPSVYALQCLEPTEVVVIPRKAIDWGYATMAQGQKLGRLIAENYFIYQDDCIRNAHMRSPGERYAAITQVFPNIHNRAPQHMIASYLGITPVHLSRLKKANS